MLDVLSAFDLCAQRLARVGAASRIVGGDVLGEEDLRLDTVEIDGARVVGQPNYQQAAAEQADRDRGRQDHRHRHGDVATKAGEDLVD
jgi:hypothetical protein